MAVAEAEVEAKREVGVRLWCCQWMMTAAEIRDDEDGGRRDAGGQNRANWAGNRQWFPTWRNGNGGFDSFVSVFCRGAVNKEPPRPSYWMRDKTMETDSQLDYQAQDCSGGSRQ